MPQNQKRWSRHKTKQNENHYLQYLTKEFAKASSFRKRTEQSVVLSCILRETLVEKSLRNGCCISLGDLRKNRWPLCQLRIGERTCSFSLYYDKYDSPREPTYPMKIWEHNGKAYKKIGRIRATEACHMKRAMAIIVKHCSSMSTISCSTLFRLAKV